MALGVAPGERVVLWASNVPEWVVLQFAIAKIGAVLVTANTALRERDIDYLLRQSEAATLITTAGVRDANYVACLEAIGAFRGALPLLARIVFIGNDPPPGATPYADACDVSHRAWMKRRSTNAAARSASTTSSTCNTRREPPVFPRA